MDEFTEPFYVREVVHRVNDFNPDAVVITGDFVTCEFAPTKFAIGAPWQCAAFSIGSPAVSVTRCWATTTS